MKTREVIQTFNYDKMGGECDEPRMTNSLGLLNSLKGIFGENQVVFSHDRSLELYVYCLTTTRRDEKRVYYALLSASRIHLLGWHLKEIAEHYHEPVFRQQIDGVEHVIVEPWRFATWLDGADHDRFRSLVRDLFHPGGNAIRFESRIEQVACSLRCARRVVRDLRAYAVHAARFHPAYKNELEYLSTQIQSVISY